MSDTKKYYCYVSGNEIPEERVEALKFLNIPENLWTCVEFSLTKKVKGVFDGEPGVSRLILAKDVRDRNKTLERLAKDDEPEDAEEET